jgi:nicotinamidase-related amidase
MMFIHENFQFPEWLCAMKRTLYFLCVACLGPMGSPAETTVNGVNVLTTIEELVNPAYSHVVVVDMQNDWISTQGEFIRKDKTVPADPKKHQIAANQWAEPVRNSRPFLDAARENGINVGYLEIILCDRMGQMLRTSGELWCNRKQTEWTPIIVEGSWGAQTIREIAPQKGEFVVHKIHGDGFYGTTLDALLKEKSAKCLLMVGGASSGCLFATALGALEHGYYPVWVSDCVEPDPEQFKRIEGWFPTFSSAEIIAAWKRIKMDEDQKAVQSESSRRIGDDDQSN